MWSLGVLGVLLILGVLEGPREAKTGKNDPAFWTKAARGELGDEEWKEFIRLGMFMLNDEHILLDLVSQN